MKSEILKSIQEIRKISLHRDKGRLKIWAEGCYNDEDFLEKDLVLFSDVQKLIEKIPRK